MFRKYYFVTWACSNKDKSTTFKSDVIRTWHNPWWAWDYMNAKAERYSKQEGRTWKSYALHKI